MTNLSLWNQVCTTDPEMTTRVTQRGGFTSIDAYYTIKRLTEQFGPLGTGWGWDASFTFHDQMIVCTASFWYMLSHQRSQCSPILTMNQYVTTKDGKQHFDEDAGKKALTDAITKWASYLGFSADVFEGKFDDNKYVESLRKQFKKDEPKPAFANEASLITFTESLKRYFQAAKSVADLQQIKASNQAKLDELKASPHGMDQGAFNALRADYADSLKILQAAEAAGQKPAQPKTVEDALKPLPPSVQADSILY